MVRLGAQKGHPAYINVLDAFAKDPSPNDTLFLERLIEKVKIRFSLSQVGYGRSYFDVGQSGGVTGRAQLVYRHLRCSICSDDEKYLNRALDHLDAVSFPIERSLVLNEYASFVRKRHSDSKRTVVLCTGRLWTYFQSRKVQVRLAKFQALLRMAFALDVIGDISGAISFAKGSIEYDDRILGEKIISGFYALRGELDKGRQLIEEAVHAWEKEHLKRAASSIQNYYGDIATILRWKGDIDGALRWHAYANRLRQRWGESLQKLPNEPECTLLISPSLCRSVFDLTLDLGRWGRRKAH